MDQNEIPHDPRHRVPSGVSKMIFEPVVFLAQTMHQSYVKISTISKRTESSFHSSLVTMEYHCVHPKWFLSQRYVWCKPCTYLASRLAHLQTDRIELPLEPLHLGVPSGEPKKWFLSLWYVWRKACTCLASRLALSPNRLNQASTWFSSPRSIIGCVQNDLWAYGMFGANYAPILHRH
jgi:hypothetical protein